MKSVINVHTFSLLALLSITRDTRLSLSLSLDCMQCHLWI